MWNSRNSAAFLFLSLAGDCYALGLRALPEFFRPDPFGGIVSADREGATWLDAVKIASARGGYASFHLVATSSTPATCRLSLELPLTADLFREWFHFNAPDGVYYPDALIPVPPVRDFEIPASDNRVPHQTAQAFWIDIWIPASVKPGIYRGRAILSSGSERVTLPMEISALAAIVPDRDAVVLDGNSYGTAWLQNQYPKTLAGLGQSPDAEDRLFRLIHAYHRVFYDHRGTYHQLGYGHAGKVSPEFAPELAGTGKYKHIASWDLFDRHYGPLLDGTAFQGSRRGPKPIPNVYLPINPEWPASFLWWGERGYETEFVNVLSAMDRHFREKNWTSTRFEVFFNQKKRYKGFPWDGDEVRFDRDNRYFIDYRRMLQKAVPEDSPVHFVMRADTSWSMAKQFEELKGIVTFWVAGQGELSWYPDALVRLRTRGDIVWTYGGTPPVQNASSAITLDPLRSWIAGVDGFVRWLAVDPGPDPWYRLAGGGETLVYPGERFGLAAPLASVRLKLQRNCQQDLALLEALARHGSRRAVQKEAVRRYNGTALDDWRNPFPPPSPKSAADWNNTDITEALRPFEARFENITPGAWLRVREFALAGEPAGGRP